MSKVLIGDRFIRLSPKLAEIVGLNEAIFIQQLHYWLSVSTNVHDGHKWVYNSYERWNEQLPFGSLTTIRRIVGRLEQAELIITGNYNTLKSDRTKWYRINYEMLQQLGGDSLILQKEETDQTEPVQKSKGTSSPSNLDQPLPKSTSKKRKEEEIMGVGVRENPHTFYEKNGFGTIGGYISERISSWCRDLSDELVLEAMKQGAEYGGKNWKYVETILRYWADRGYRTVDEVHAAQLAFRERLSKNRSPTLWGRDIAKDHTYDIDAGESDD